MFLHKANVGAKNKLTKEGFKASGDSKFQPRELSMYRKLFQEIIDCTQDHVTGLSDKASQEREAPPPEEGAEGGDRAPGRAR